MHQPSALADHTCFNYLFKDYSLRRSSVLFSLHNNLVKYSIFENYSPLKMLDIWIKCRQSGRK